MPLPTPKLDDRRFQDIVDEAKSRITRYCPEWTDHNVSDPGIALIELFAWMTDLMLYRVNQVPDKLYIKFLELIGVRLEAPRAARAPVTFYLSAAHRRCRARSPVAPRRSRPRMVRRLRRSTMSRSCGMATTRCPSSRPSLCQAMPSTSPSSEITVNTSWRCCSHAKRPAERASIHRIRRSNGRSGVASRPAGWRASSSTTARVDSIV